MSDEKKVINPRKMWIFLLTEKKLPEIIPLVIHKNVDKSFFIKNNKK